MSKRIKELAHEIVRLQAELDREIERRRNKLGWTVKERLVEFQHGIVAEHRRLRTGVTSFVRRSPLSVLATAPVIYSLMVPLLLLDVWVSLYQAVCFRAYRISRVRRRDFIALDRGQLAYLNWIEALNCIYCGYGNGVIAYVREVAGRTEQYWCPIKHAVHIPDPHDRYLSFVEFGDAEGYRSRLACFREALRSEVNEHPSAGAIGSPLPQHDARRET